jgi:hypothetical protein
MNMSRRGFTRTEAVVGFVAMVVIGAIALFVLPTMGRTGRGNRGLTDQTQVRGIHQGMVLFAQNNQDRYPIPSELDKGHTTLSSTSGKDDPGSVLSILIYAGFFSPELTVSPAEAKPRIKPSGTPPSAARAPSS